MSLTRCEGKAESAIGTKLVLLDLDGTLIDAESGPVPVLLPGAAEALDALSACGYAMALCTHNRDADPLCRRLGIHAYFESMVAAGVRDMHKQWNLDQLRARHPTIDPGSMLLFDDDPAVVAHFRSQGVRACLVPRPADPRSGGLDIDQLIQADLIPIHPVFAFFWNPFL